MKQVTMAIVLCFGMFQTLSQPTIFITTSKTTSIVFSQAIRYIDRGTNDILVQQVKAAENILLVKAGKKNFCETNLSVVTGDGRLHSFKVLYDSMPKLWVYNYPKVDTSNKSPGNEIIFNDEDINVASISTYATGILDNDRKLYGIRDKKWGMQLRIDGIYIKENVLFFHLSLQNNSRVDYDIDFIRMYIRDRKKLKRTASQELEMSALKVAGNTHLVKARNKAAIVLSVPKFTIPDAKYFAIEMMEQNGGRHLFLKIGNKVIVQAQTLPDLK